jgi:hypothetical protein
MLEFESAIERLPGKIVWPVIYIPASFAEEARTKSRINVIAEVEGLRTRCTLLPSKNGHYLVYTKEMREHCSKEIGQVVRVKLEIDDQPRELEIPQDVEEALTNNGVKDEFEKKPYYIRRDEIGKINSAKAQETRERRIKALVDRLRTQAG